jgi:hypothetical protein
MYGVAAFFVCGSGNGSVDSDYLHSVSVITEIYNKAFSVPALKNECTESGRTGYRKIQIKGPLGIKMKRINVEYTLANFAIFY